MSKKGKIRNAIDNIQKEFALAYDPGNRYSVVRQEGWDGGYQQALRDVLLVLRGLKPQGQGERFWRTEI